jgi:hypothetical protein
MSRSTARTRLATTIGAAVLGAAATGAALGTAGPAAAAPTTRDAAATSATTAAAPRSALLGATEMPEVNNVQDWRRVATRSTRVSKAQPESLAALGATDRARRDFALPGGQASSVVLTFDDAKEAADAYAEVRSWRQHTGDNVPAGGRLLFTGKHVPVTVESGRGSYFSFVFKRDRAADEGTFEWLGVTRRGAALSIVAWRIDGQDATYDVDPTIASVRTANEKLAGLNG